MNWSETGQLKILDKLPLINDTALIRVLPVITGVGDFFRNHFDRGKKMRALALSSLLRVFVAGGFASGVSV
ncbi:hypothetical protein [Paraburkholderia sp. ZP32-5]|uniref:hypothetical protein n=1 Tax=Paraburkholderia sp. ZP32-5 TaxID=2883245 RepID=UPI001F259AE2|nr:hypothetical protein [Paraburkholderia sp. ZP32-5]